MIEFKLTSTKQDLEEILALQQKNLPQHISSKEQQKEGFVTVEHTLEILHKMHKAHPHIIALHNSKIVGYALCMGKEFKNDIPVLTPMFDEIEASISALENTINYIVMGQICVAKSFRRKGIFRGLYSVMKQHVSPHYDAIITEISLQNKPSSKAHKSIGFESLKTYTLNTQEWELILLPC